MAEPVAVPSGALGIDGGAAATVDPQAAATGGSLRFDSAAPTGTWSAPPLAVTSIPVTTTLPTNTTSPTDTISNPIAAGADGSTNNVPFGLVVGGPVVVALLIFVIIIYFVRKQIMRKNRGMRREDSLTQQDGESQKVNLCFLGTPTTGIPDSESRGPSLEATVTEPAVQTVQVLDRGSVPELALEYLLTENHYPTLSQHSSIVTTLPEYTSQIGVRRSNGSSVFLPSYRTDEASTIASHNTISSFESSSSNVVPPIEHVAQVSHVED